MPATAPIECDLIDSIDSQKIRTVRMATLPSAGDEIDLDLGDDRQAVFRVVRLRYHVRPRKLVRTDDVIGVSIFIAPA